MKGPRGTKCEGGVAATAPPVCRQSQPGVISRHFSCEKRMAGMQHGQDPNPPCCGLGAHSNDVWGAGAGLHNLEPENPLKELRVAAINAWHR